MAEPLEPEAWVPCPFPVDVFPPSVIAFIDEVSQALPCPPDFLGMGILTVAGSMIGATRKLEVKGGWEEQANLFGVIVANPGCLKTPALEHVMAPVRIIQSGLRDEFQQRQMAYEKDRMQYRAKLSAYREGLKQHLKNPQHNDPPEEPGDPPVLQGLEHVWADDTTTEALAVMLESSPRGITVFCDELTAWVRSFNQFKGGKGADRQFYLKAWSGKAIKVDRKSSLGAPIIIDNPFIAVLGTIQPDLLEELVDEKGREDGFVHRILFSMPDADPAPELTGVQVSKPTKELWATMTHRLRALAFDEKVVTVNEGQDEKPIIRKEPKLVKFSEEAKLEFALWHQRHRDEVLSEKFPRQLVGPWAKLKGYMVRFILVLHMLRHCEDDSIVPADTVDPEDVLAAEKLVNYFKHHYKGVFLKFGYDPKDKVIEDFVQWIKTEKGGQATVRDIYRTRRWGIKSASDAQKFLALVADRGFGNFGNDKLDGMKDKALFRLKE